MSHTAQTNQRNTIRKILFISIITVFFITVFLLVRFFFHYSSISPQLGLLVTNRSSTIVYVINTRAPFIHAIVFDNTIEIPGVYALGNYSISALKKLGETDSTRLRLLQESMEEAIAYPIQYSVDILDEQFPMLIDSNVPDAYTYISDHYHMIPYILRHFYPTTSNFPLAVEYTLFQLVSVIPKRTVTSYHATSRESPLVRKSEKQDGTESLIFDPTLLDQTVGFAMEDPLIRNDELTVSIYNTTAITGLGKRMERYLTHQGATVLAVAASETPYTSCVLITNEAKNSRGQVQGKELLQFMKDIFQCKEGASDLESPYDMTIWIGMDYGKKFVPNQ